jgi:hypothetical protein
MRSKNSKPYAILALVMWIGLAPVHAGETITFSVRGSLGYTVNDQLNPDITLKRGVTYTIAVMAPGHPLWIKTVKSSGTDNAYTKGITGNGTAEGAITFAVPVDAPEQLFYNCLIHPMMNGVIKITN